MTGFNNHSNDHSVNHSANNSGKGVNVNAAPRSGSENQAGQKNNKPGIGQGRSPAKPFNTAIKAAGKSNGSHGSNHGQSGHDVSGREEGGRGSK